MINEEKTQICQLCKNHKKKTELLPLGLVDTELLEFIKERYPECGGEGYICSSDLRKIRLEYF